MSSPALSGDAHHESRWPAALAVLALFALLTVVPGRVRLLPEWVVYVTTPLVLLPIIGTGLSPAKARWRKAEHAAMFLLFAITVPGMLVTLAYLVAAMVGGTKEVSGLQLFVSSVALWSGNVLIFALAYWHVDRGGPHGRATDPAPLPDWLFPQYDLGSDRVPIGWHPAFMDYLYLALSTATAFSTTDVAPITARAKRLMTIEILISLVTIVVVGARAINVLGN